MSKARLQYSNFEPPKKPNVLYPICVLWGSIFLLIAGYFIYDSFLFDRGSNYYLLPWSILTGVALSLPSLYLLYKKEFNPFHPLVLPAWSYLIPGFAVGGLILTFGLSEPYYLTFVQDERYNLPLTLVYVSIGYLSLAIGFYLPYSFEIGQTIGKKLPKWNWTSEQLIFPGLILLALGFFNNILAFSAGVLGYQQVAQIGTFDGVIFLVTMFWLQASFLLWLCIFRTEKLVAHHYAILAILLGSSIIKSAFQGNRGSLYALFILIAFAFVMSERKVEFKHKAIAGFLVVAAIGVGIVYGTTFRSIKKVSDDVSIEQYAEMIAQTFTKIVEQDMGEVLADGVDALAVRIESVSSVAVVVSTYEKQSAYEASYGLDNNILKDTVTFLIPRVLWADKPLATDPASYGGLYFDFEENSFTLTPFGDLLRNFGPWGIPIGMLILGFILRIMYSAIIEGFAFSYWRATLYYMTISSVSYEGSYGLIVPYTIKIMLVTILGIVILRLLIGRTR